MIARAALVLIAAFGLGGCDTAARIYVANRSGATVQLRHANARLEGRPEILTSIGDGQARDFAFADVVRARTLALEAQGCTYSYAFPPMPWYRGFNAPPLPVQIEPSLALYLKPRGAGPSPPEALPTHQRDGFPIRPEKVCPAG